MSVVVLTVLLLDKAGEVVVWKVVPVLELDPLVEDGLCDGDGDEKDAMVCDEELACIDVTDEDADPEIEDAVCEDELPAMEDRDGPVTVLPWVDELAGAEDGKVVDEEPIVCEEAVADKEEEEEEEESLEPLGLVGAVDAPTVDDLALDDPPNDDPAVKVDCDDADGAEEEDVDSEDDPAATEDVREEEEGLDDNELPDVP